MAHAHDSLIQVALPESLRRYVDKKVSTGGYASASDFVGEAIREKLERENAKSELARQLVEGLESGTAAISTKGYFEQKKAALVARMRGRNGAQ